MTGGHARGIGAGFLRGLRGGLILLALVFGAAHQAAAATYTSIL